MSVIFVVLSMEVVQILFWLGAKRQHVTVLLWSDSEGDHKEKLNEIFKRYLYYSERFKYCTSDHKNLNGYVEKTILKSKDVNFLLSCSVEDNI